jgi:hypothetical protein
MRIDQLQALWPRIQILAFTPEQFRALHLSKFGAEKVLAEYLRELQNLKAKPKQCHQSPQLIIKNPLNK